MTTTVDTAELIKAQEQAQADAAKAQAIAHEASAKLAAVEASIEAERRSRYLAWCQNIVDQRHKAERAALAHVNAMRVAFYGAVAEGDLNAALQRFLDWNASIGAQFGLQRKISHALSQIDPNGRQPEMSLRGQPGTLAEELSNAAAQAAAAANADQADAAQAEIGRALAGKAAPDGA